MELLLVGDGPGPVSAGLPGRAGPELTLSPADAEMVRQGQLAPSVAFMQGRLKTSGDNALLLSRAGLERHGRLRRARWSPGWPPGPVRARNRASHGPS